MLRPGQRVTHRNMFPGGPPLPMSGTVVEVRDAYIGVVVQWDSKPSAVSSGKPVAYHPDVLEAIS